MPPIFYNGSNRADGIKGPYVFINERGHPFGRMGIGRQD